MKEKPMLFCLIMLSVYSCSNTRNTLGAKYSDVSEMPQKLEFYNSLSYGAFQVSNHPAFVIEDQNELNAAMNEIMNADNPSPWKGAAWNHIKLYFKDTIITLKTNNKIIGFSSSGQFYTLQKITL